MRSLFPRPFVLLGAAVLGLACGNNTDSTQFGNLAITTSMPSTSLTTTDVWNVAVTKMLVHFTAVTVAGSDGVVAASASPQLADMVAPGPQTLLIAAVRTARPWQAVSLEIGPAPAGTIALLPPVTTDERDQMQKDALSLYVEATLTKDTTTKKLQLGFTTDTLNQNCTGDLGGAQVPGLVVPPNGADTANVALGAAILFADDLTVPAPTTHAQPFADADSNNDGIVTLDDLRATPLDGVRTLTGATYAAGDGVTATDLGAFVEAASRRIVATFRDKGACTATAQAAQAQP